MSATIMEQAVHTLEIVKEEEIAAPIDVVFETILEEMGPRNQGGDKQPMPMKLEAWPGGRWFRDLGNGAGHFWGHVQAIKAPSLLEIWGPLFMSHPAVSNVQYRLKEESGVTLLTFTHRAIGYIAYDPKNEEQWGKIHGGWGGLLERIRMASVRK
ncbi:SRPBCC domain-containing protein [Granulicella sp. 5B5]|uniref:SRPBCC family protein n=1 Tax=Granulicella sp. 5B5 TaxID=1617967 RepID=UPI0015F5BB2B|nr:SRPBCC domain-containing protein [Granulicella sp. 5B5]QMV17898.1 SRPBCC domain-containing protein [Granulicella sp. 5B5]